MGDLLYFPLRRVASLGVPGETVTAIRAAMPNVAISSQGSALERCNLLLIAEDEPGVEEIVDWLHRKTPELPVLIARAEATTGELVEHCRALLFSGEDVN